MSSGIVCRARTMISLRIAAQTPLHAWCKGCAMQCVTYRLAWQQFQISVELMHRFCSAQGVSTLNRLRPKIGSSWGDAGRRLFPTGDSRVIVMLNWRKSLSNASSSSIFKLRTTACMLIYVRPLLVVTANSCALLGVASYIHRRELYQHGLELWEELAAYLEIFLFKRLFEEIGIQVHLFNLDGHPFSSSSSN